MIVLDEEKLSIFFESVASGFQRSLFEIVLSVALLLLFVVFLIVVHRLQKRKTRREVARRDRERYRRLLDKNALNPQEQDLIERLATQLHSPQKAYLLLVHQPTFNACAGRLGPGADAALLAALRLKLGFGSREPEKAIASSAELEPGTPLFIRREKGEDSAGRIIRIMPSALVVSLDRPEGAAAGSTVTVFLQSASGLFSFQSQILSSNREELHLAHAENITRYQRRRYYRRQADFPVYVRRAGEDSLKLSLVRDLGGGGASLQNPRGIYKAGDDLELSFHPEGSFSFTLLAEVLRTSRQGKLLHVRFGPLKESTRDHIFSLLFKPQ
jgi:c-di-GMP-binding flagellar brake protein YcgR